MTAGTLSIQVDDEEQRGSSTSASGMALGTEGITGLLRCRMSDDGGILITGAAGFAGSSLAKALLAKGHRVSGLDVVAPAHAGLLQEEFSHPNFRYVWRSVQDIQPSDIAGAFGGGPPGGAARHPDGIRLTYGTP